MVAKSDIFESPKNARNHLSSKNSNTVTRLGENSNRNPIRNFPGAFIKMIRKTLLLTFAKRSSSSTSKVQTNTSKNTFSNNSHKRHGENLNPNRFEISLGRLSKFLEKCLSPVFYRLSSSSSKVQQMRTTTFRRIQKKRPGGNVKRNPNRNFPAAVILLRQAE